MTTKLPDAVNAGDNNFGAEKATSLVLTRFLSFVSLLRELFISSQ